MATVSEVKICNLALSNLGARSRIESLTENSTEAKECNLWYDFAREAALEAFDWNFATKRLTLATDVEAPPDNEWSYRYQYPSDCVSAREIVNPFGNPSYIGEDPLLGDAIPFVVETSSDGTRKTILTDLNNADLRYTRNLDDTTLFSNHFIFTMAAQLAMLMAVALTGKVALRQSLNEEFQRLIRIAPAHNANEAVRRKPVDSVSIRGRE